MKMSKIDSGGSILSGEVTGPEEIRLQTLFDSLPPDSLACENQQGESVSHERVINFLFNYAAGAFEYRDLKIILNKEIPNREEIINTVEELRKNALATKEQSVVPEAEIIIYEFQGDSIEDMIEFCEQNDIKSSVESGAVKITADILRSAFQLARNSKFIAMDGFTRNHGLREAAAKILIQETRSWDELYTLLDTIESVSTSNGKVTGQSLKADIEAFRKGERVIGQITSRHNLRAKVVELRAAEVESRQAA